MALAALLACRTENKDGFVLGFHSSLYQ